MAARIIIGPPGSGRSAALLSELRGAGSGLVLAPTDAALAALQQSWGETREPEWHTPRSLARAILQLAAQQLNWSRGRHVLSALSRRLLLRHAWSDLARAGPAPLFERYGDSPFSLQTLLPLFDLLAASLGSAEPQALICAPGASAELVEIAQVYRRYLALCEDRHVLAFQEVEGLAVDVLRSPQIAAALPWRSVAFAELDAARPEQVLLFRRLIDSLAGGGDSPAIFASATTLDSPAGDHQLQLVADLVASLNLEPMTLEPRPLPASPLLAGLCPASSAAGEPLSMAELGHPEEEAHFIAQTIACDLLEHAERRFADYAVICWSRAASRAIERVLREYGILVAVAAARPIAANPLTLPARAGAALLAGRALPQDLERELLRCPLFALPDAEISAISSAQGGLLAVLNEQATVALSERGTALLQRLAAALAQARASSSLARGLWLWLEHSGALALLDAREGSLALEEADRRICWLQIERAIASLHDLERTAERIGERLGPAALPDAYDEALLLAQSETLEPEGDAVALWDVQDLYGRRAAVVFLAGMDEESLPPREPALQPAAGEELAVAFGQLPGFVAPQQQEPAVVLERARRRLALALSRADERVVLSYSKSGMDARPRLPSPLFLDLLGPQAIAAGRLQLPDPPAHASAWLRLQRGLGANNPPLSLTPAAVAGSSDAALLPHIEQLERLLGAEEQPRAVLPPASLQGSDFVASATHIRDYLACPRRYYYARLLALGAEEGERLALGQLFHAVVEQLMDEWEALAPQQRLRRGLALFRREWARFGHRLGPPLHQVSYRRLLRQGLAALIAHETERVRLAGRRSVARERRFRLSWRDGSTIIGVIDRIDLLPDGRYALIDYKTGSSNPSLAALLNKFIPLKNDEDWQAEDVQLPLYALALEQGAVEDVTAGPVAEISLLFPFELRTGRGSFSDKGWRRIQLVEEGEPRDSRPVAALPRAALQRTWEEIDRALAGMRSGPYPPAPRELRICRSCPYRFSCPQPAGDDEGAPHEQSQ